MCRAVIAAALAGFALSGCASTKPVEAPSNFAWSYSVNPGEGAKLAFGRPQSDEVVLMMVCAEPGASVMLSAAGLNTAQLMLTSGQSSTSVKGEVGEGFGRRWRPGGSLPVEPRPGPGRLQALRRPDHDRRRPHHRSGGVRRRPLGRAPFLQPMPIGLAGVPRPS